jgi:hypothetical protein
MGLIETACLVVGQSFPSHDREFPSRRKAGLNGICHAMGNKRAELMIAAVGKRPTGLLQDHFHAYCGATELRARGALGQGPIGVSMALCGTWNSCQSRRGERRQAQRARKPPREGAWQIGRSVLMCPWV